MASGGLAARTGVRAAIRAASSRATKMTTARPIVWSRTCQSPSVTIGSNASSMTGWNGSVGTTGVYPPACPRNRRGPRRCRGPRAVVLGWWSVAGRDHDGLGVSPAVDHADLDALVVGTGAGGPDVEDS